MEVLILIWIGRGNNYNFSEATLRGSKLLQQELKEKASETKYKGNADLLWEETETAE